MVFGFAGYNASQGIDKVASKLLSKASNYAQIKGSVTKNLSQAFTYKLMYFM